VGGLGGEWGVPYGVVEEEGKDFGIIKTHVLQTTNLHLFVFDSVLKTVKCCKIGVGARCGLGGCGEGSNATQSPLRCALRAMPEHCGCTVADRLLRSSSLPR